MKISSSKPSPTFERDNPFTFVATLTPDNTKSGVVSFMVDNSKIPECSQLPMQSNNGKIH